MTTLNPSDLSAGVVLSNGNLTAGATVDTSIAVRSTEGQPSGKFYFEVLFRWGGLGANASCGIGTLVAPLTGLALNNVGWAVVNQSGAIIINGVFTGVSISNLTSYPSGAIFVATRCIAVDLGVSRIWFRTNAEIWNADGSADPASNVGGFDISSLFPTNPAFAGLGFQSAAAIATTETANFGGSSFAFSPPSGFSGGPSGVFPWAASGAAAGFASVQAIAPAATTGLADGFADVIGVPLLGAAGGGALLAGL